MLNLLPGGKPAYVIDLVTVITIFLSLRYFELTTKNLTFNSLDFAVFLYFILSICSGLLYLYPQNPTNPKAYFYGIHYFVLPMFMYYATRLFNPNLQMKILRLLWFLNIASIVLGLTLFYARPSFYRSFLVDKMFSSIPVQMEEWQIFGRLQSYLGSTSMGTIISTTIVLFTLTGIPLRLIILFLPIVMIASILTFQRAGLVTSIIAVFYLVIKTPKSLALKILVPTVIILFSMITLPFFVDVEESILLRLKDKYSWNSLVELFAESRGYGPGVSYIVDYPLGIGIGGTSSVAESEGLASRGQVVDANFMRILADLGIIGFLSFFFVIWQAGKAALKKKKNGEGWIILIGLVCIICIGTNTLDSYYVSHIFWTFLGVVGTRDIDNNCQYGSITIQEAEQL